jgi:hypothetical protein
MGEVGRELELNCSLSVTPRSTQLRMPGMRRPTSTHTDSDSDVEVKSSQKSYCELHYTEFFWGPVKRRWLRENCTFPGLQDNFLPKAFNLKLNAVALETIRKWEHRMDRWMDTYRGVLSARDAQFNSRYHISKYVHSTSIYSRFLIRNLNTTPPNFNKNREWMFRDHAS